MKFVIIGKNIDVTPGLKASVEDKIGKLSKYFSPDTQVNVTLSVEKERQKIEVTIPVKGSIILNNMVLSEYLPRNFRKEKIKDHRQRISRQYYK